MKIRSQIWLFGSELIVSHEGTKFQECEGFSFVGGMVCLTQRCEGAKRRKGI